MTMADISRSFLRGNGANHSPVACAHQQKRRRDATTADRPLLRRPDARFGAPSTPPSMSSSRSAEITIPDFIVYPAY
jgi:hypothetical protein